MNLFEWDPQKDEINRRKHGVRLEDAAQVFLGLTVTWNTSRQEEIRFATVGIVKGSTLLVIWTPRQNVIRLISARRTKRTERERFDQEVRRAASAGRH